MKVFNLHWLGGKVERITGNSIEEAARNAGIGGGALRALDYWEEVSELPLNEKYLKHENEYSKEYIDIANPHFVKAIRALETISVGQNIAVEFANRIFNLVVEKIDAYTIYIKQLSVEPLSKS